MGPLRRRLLAAAVGPRSPPVQRARRSGAVRSGHGAVRGAPAQPTTPMSTRSPAARGCAARAAPSGVGGADGVCGAEWVSDAAGPRPRAHAHPALSGSPPPPTPSPSPTSSPCRVPHDAASLPPPTRTPGGCATAPRTSSPSPPTSGCAAAPRPPTPSASPSPSAPACGVPASPAPAAPKTASAHNAGAGTGNGA